MYYAKLNPLRLGSIHPRGWLLEQLTRNKNGMGGHLPELEPHMIATPYTTHETEENWGKARRAGWGAEISGAYWNGLIELAFSLGDPELIAMADKWVNEVLANIREDGYLGTYTEDDDFFDDFNLGGNARGYDALLTYYDATHREDVLEAVHNALLWFCKNWAGDRKTSYGGIGCTRPMSTCYRYTGDERLLKFCEEYFEFLERKDLFGRSMSAYASPVLHYNCNHGAGFAGSIETPNEVYQMNGDPAYLEASVNAARKARNLVVQKTGGVTCESEYLAPVGANVETEYCAITNYNFTNIRLLQSTADALYGDEMERAVFNAGEGARKKDEKAIAYLSSPNQIFATENSSIADHHHQVYAPCVPVSCCPVYSVRLLPEYLRASVMTDDCGGIWFTVYAPSEASLPDISFSLDTLYPFRDTLKFTVSAAKPVAKTLHFRIPGWCDGAYFTVNGEKRDISCKAGEFAVLEDEWKNGDVIILTLPMKVRVSQVDDSDRSSKFPIVIEYGPLLYALPLIEKWQAFEGHPFTPLPEGWYWYNVKPEIPRSNLDLYDDIGARKELINWNVALDERLTSDQVSVTLSEPEGYPWEKSPIRLKVTGWKAPYAYAPYMNKTMDPHGPKGRVTVTHPVELELIPFGCTALRISYFPRADLKS